MKSFIDDNDEIENDKTFYQKFENVTTSIDDVLEAEYDKSIVDIQKIDVSNFCETSEKEIEIEIDEFKDTEKRIKKILQSQQIMMMMKAILIPSLTQYFLQ